MPAKPNAATTAPVLQPAQVEGREGAMTYRWMRVVDAIAAQAGGNPKLHDIGKLSLSILENGFIDAPKWDENLNHGAGGIVYGNGRLEALAYLEQMHRTGQELNGEPVPRPRGIGTERETGAWVLQVAFGLDAATPAQAQRLLIDHNNLTLAGGSFTALDMSRLYRPDQYQAMLTDIEGSLGADGDTRLLDDGQITLTVDTEDFELLAKLFAEDNADFSQSTNDQDLDPGQDASQLDKSLGMASLTLKYLPEQYAEVEQLIAHLTPELEAFSPSDCILKALRAATLQLD